MPAQHPDFRLGSMLATSFTATLTERQGEPVERIPTPQRCVDWLVVSGLAVDSCTSSQLDIATELREAIHAAGRPPEFDQTAYAGRNVVERQFGLAKQWRGIATRYDKHAITYRASVVLCAVIAWLRK